MIAPATILTTGDVCPIAERFSQRIVSMRSGIPAAAPLEALLALRYSNIHWWTCCGGCFAAIDEYCFPAIIVVDVAPLIGGYPEPRVSPARAASIGNLCQSYLLDRTRLHKVRADYLVLPEGCHASGDVPLAHRPGVAWAFADERLVRERPCDSARRLRIVKGVVSQL